MSRGGPTARLFAAVDPPSTVRHELSSWAREAAGAMRAGAGGGGEDGPQVRVLAPDTLHVTLCFLGSRPVEEIGTLADALGRCEACGGELELGAPLRLPPRDPRSLALEVHDSPRGWLAELHDTLSEAFAQAVGWQVERRRFRAHVTVARLGRSGKPSRRARAGGRSRGRQGARQGGGAGRPDATARTKPWARSRRRLSSRSRPRRSCCTARGWTRRARATSRSRREP